MGAAEGKEQSVGKLLTDKEQWKEIIDEFLQNPFSVHDSSGYKVDISVLEILCEILEQQISLLNQYDTGVEDINKIFETIRRLLTSKYLYRQLTKNQNCSRQIFQSIDVSTDTKILPLALKTILHILEYKGKTPDEELWYEVENKKFYFADEGYIILLSLICKYEPQDDKNSEDIIESCLTIIHSFLITHQKTTVFEELHKFLAEILKRNYLIHFFNLLHHKNFHIRSKSIQIFKQIMLEIEHVNFKYVQNLAREHGEILWQTLFCLSETPDDPDFTKQQIELSLEMLSYLCDANEQNIEIIASMLPEDVMKWTLENEDMDIWLPVNSVIQDVDSRPKNSRLSRQQKKELSSKVKYNKIKRRNWKLTFERLRHENFKEPTIIWNQETLNELIEKLKTEINELKSIRQITGKYILWDDTDFQVEYYSLKNVLKSGPYYLENLLEKLSSRDSSFTICDPQNFMDKLVKKSVIEDSDENKKIIFITMKQIYTIYETQFENFEHMDYLVWLLSPKHCSSEWKEDLLLLLKKLFSFTSNIRSFVRYNGISKTILHLQQIPKVKSSEQSLMGINILALLEAVCTFPRSRKALASEKYIQYIVQLLLCDRINIVNQAIILLSHVLESNPHIHPFLYKTGIFSFIMRLMEHGCPIATALLLKQYHSLQSHDKESRSYLDYFLPSPFISILEKDNGAELFCKIMSSDYISQPNIFWTSQMRSTLVEQVEEDIQEFINSLKEDPTTVFQYKTPKTVSYENLDEKLCVGDIYVKTFCEQPDFPLEDPEDFLLNLVEHLNSEYNSQFILYNLQAQMELFRRYGNHRHFARYSGMEILCSILSSLIDNEMSDSDLDIGSKICELLSSVFTCSVSVKSTYNKDVFIRSDVVSHLISVTYNMLRSSSKTEKQTKFISHVVQMFSELCNEGSVQKLLLQKSTFFFELGDLYSPNQVRDDPHLSLRVLETIKKFGKCEALQKKMVENACMFSLLRIAVLFEISDTENENKINGFVHRKCIITAINCLAVLSQHDGAAHVLKQSLTNNLFYSIGQDEEMFMNTSRRDVQTPLIIWNSETRNELKSMVVNQMLTLKKKASKMNEGSNTVLFNPHEFKFSFKYLENELIINNVYIHVFNKNPTKNIGSEQKFCSELLYSLYEDYTFIKEHIKNMNSSESSRHVETRMELSMVKIHALENLFKHQPASSEAIPAGRQNPLSDLVVIIVAYRDILLSHIPQLFSQILSTLIDAHHRIVTTEASPCIQYILMALHYMLLADKQFPVSRDKILGMISRAVSKSSETAHKVIKTGFVITILISLLDTTNYSFLDRSQSAKIVWTLSVTEETKSTMQQILYHVFNPKFTEINTVPEDNAIDFVLSLVSDDHETPRSIWNDEVRTETLAILKKIAEPIFTHLKSVDAMKNRNEFSWSIDMIPTDYWDRSALSDELRVHGIYVRCFNESPFFSLSHPEEFLKELLARIKADFSVYHRELKSLTDSSSPRSLNTQNLIILWEAVKNVLLNNHELKPICISHLSLFCDSFDHRSSKKILSSVIEVLELLTDNPDFVKHLSDEQMLAHIVRGIYLLPNNQKMLSSISNIVTLNHHVIVPLKRVGTLIYLLNVIINSRERKIREASAEILNKMVKNAPDNRIAEDLCDILTQRFSSCFEKKSDKFIDFFDSDHETEKRVWNGEIREKLGSLLQQQTEWISESTAISNMTKEESLNEKAKNKIMEFWNN
eukprot:gb/GECH01004690.1/.p1 GENE.gb/GECH01004690.1/~~gb/GECH01004690.1/.p1  ORF type:complete len:1716 (+),score=351.91 gb/GECH01004690.1/:1-5148(+)